MFTTTRYHFEIYASVEGTATDFRRLRDYMRPRFEAMGVCFDATVRLHSKVNGHYKDDDEIDWTSTESVRYQFHVVYDGTEETLLSIGRVRKAVDSLCKYYRLRWHEDRMQTVV